MFGFATGNASAHGATGIVVWIQQASMIANGNLKAPYAPDAGRVLRAYGKLGLLVDDAPLAPGRVARELYGSDELPEFWVHVRSIADGIRELTIALDTAGRELPVLLVVDRVLPTNRESLAEYWETEADESCVRFLALVKVARERQGGSAGRFRVLLITSYPGKDVDAQTKLDWTPRFHQPLFRARRDGSIGESLLRCRPETNAPIRNGGATPKSDADRWRADQAKALLDNLVIQLREPERVSLLTGAGMSVTSNIEHPGMPWNDWLLTRAACECLRSEYPDRHIPESAWREQREHRVVDWKEPTLQSSFEDELQKALKIGACISQFARTGEVASVGEFNSLFSDNPCDLELEFRKHLRRTVLRYDEGITHRHWLAAKLPFALRLTTNFDGFHQRAAAHVASKTGEAPEPVVSAYGNAAQDRFLAWSEGDFEAKLSPLMTQLELFAESPSAGTRPVTMVIVGHGLRDIALLERLTLILDRHSDSSILWVTPEAHEIVSALGTDEPPKGFSERKMFNALTKLHGNSRINALPMRAVDFFYDLAEQYHARKH
jgi:hypothetical protein